MPKVNELFSVHRDLRKASLRPTNRLNTVDNGRLVVEVLDRVRVVIRTELDLQIDVTRRVELRSDALDLTG